MALAESHPWLAPLLVFLAVNFLCAVRAVPWARRTGRSPTLWFAITLLLTAIPAAVAALRQGLAGREPKRPQGHREPLQRCPHCHRLLDPPGASLPGQVRTCSRCGMALEEGTTA